MSPWLGRTEAETQVKPGMQGRQGLQMLLLDQFAPMPDPVEQPDLTPGLFFQAPVEHAQHGGDADTPRNQHDRAGSRLEVEVAGGCTHLNHLPDGKLIVDKAGATPRWRLGPGRCAGTLHRNPVSIGIRCIGQGIAAHYRIHVARRARHLEPESEELPWQERRQGLQILRCQVNGTDRTAGILESLAGHPKVAQSGPGGIGGTARLGLGWQHGNFSPLDPELLIIQPVPPETQAQINQQLQDERPGNPGQEYE